MDKYGELSTNIKQLDENIELVKLTWKDQTGESFYVMNEGIKQNIMNIISCKKIIGEAYDDVLRGYNKEEIDSLIKKYASQVSEA